MSDSGRKSVTVLLLIFIAFGQILSVSFASGMKTGSITSINSVNFDCSDCDSCLDTEMTSAICLKMCGVTLLAILPNAFQPINAKQVIFNKAVRITPYCNSIVPEPDPPQILSVL